MYFGLSDFMFSPEIPWLKVKFYGTHLPQWLEVVQGFFSLERHILTFFFAPKKGPAPPKDGEHINLKTPRFIVSFLISRKAEMGFQNKFLV